MSLIERVGSGIKRGVDTASFIIKHDSTPDIVERARRVVVRNEQFLQEWMEVGLVTSDRLQEIENDTELQDEYKTMMRHIRDGGKKSQRVLEKLIFQPIDYQAGWLEYYRKFHERRFNINLRTEEEISI